MRLLPKLLVTVLLFVSHSALPEDKAPDQTILNALIERVQHGEILDRIDAVHTLEKMGANAHAAIPILTRMLRYGNDKISESAVDALGSIGSENVVPALVISMYSNDKDVVSAAERALNRAGFNTERRPEILGKLLDSNDKDLRECSNTALIRLGKGGASAIPSLLKKINDPDKETRRLALCVLKGMGTQAGSAVPAAIEALKDTDRYVRSEAASVLCAVSVQDAMPAKAALIEALKEKENSNVRNQAAYALTRLVGPDDRTFIPVLLPLIYDPSTWCFVPQLFKRIKPELDDVLPELSRALKYHDRNTRSLAVMVLSDMGLKAKDAGPVLAEALKDSDESVRRSAASALLRVGADREALQTVPIYIENLGDDSDYVRRNAMTALMKMNISMEKIIDPLVAELKSTDEKVRAHGVFALRELEPRPIDAVPALCITLKDKNATIRMWALQALERIDGPHLELIDKQATPAVMEQLKPDDDYLLTIRSEPVTLDSSRDWKILAEAKGAKSHLAIWSIAAGGESSLAFVREQIGVGLNEKTKRIKDLISELDSDEYSIRENASKVLREMHTAFASRLAVRQALIAATSENKSPELKSRTNAILSDKSVLKVATLEQLRLLRALAALRCMQFPGATELISYWSPELNAHDPAPSPRGRSRPINNQD